MMNQKKPNGPGRSSGFTVLELVVVMAIVGVVGAVGFLLLPQDAPELRESASLLAADIRLTRSEAIRLNTTVDMRFDTTNNRYQLSYLNEDVDPAERVVLLNRRLNDSFGRVSIDSAAFTLVTTDADGNMTKQTSDFVSFDSRGLPRNLTSNAQIKLASKNNAERTAFVCLQPQGRVLQQECSTL